MNRERVQYFSLLYLLFGVFVISSLPGGAVAQSTNLYYGVFITLNRVTNFSSFIPALELGVKTINNHSTVLKRLNGRDYNISYEISNARVSG